MPLVPFKDLMAQAEREEYAVGYFESWNMESLQAVADAAEAAGSPVIMGFSGIYLSHSQRIVSDPLRDYAALGLEVCRRLAVPACLVFNECAVMERVMEAVDLGFQLVMFTEENLPYEQQAQLVTEVVRRAHARSAAVEGEITPLPGAGGDAVSPLPAAHLTDVRQARDFVERTGIDALAVNIGQAHLHGRAKVTLNMARLKELKDALDVPLVLHGASSISHGDTGEAIRIGIRKINVGSNLKRAYFEALRQACMEVGRDYNPYEIIGSGFARDVMAIGRIALQKTVEDLMRLFGSSGRA